MERNEKITNDQLVDYIKVKVQTKKHMDTNDSSSPIDYITDQNPKNGQCSYHDRRRQKNQSYDQPQIKQHWPQQNHNISLQLISRARIKHQMVNN